MEGEAFGAITLGIDLAAQPAGTAACRLLWRDGHAEALTLSHGLDDAALTRLRTEAGTVAIDAPFGWPEGLASALSLWAGERRWPEVTPQELRYRVTDLEVQRRTGIWPLSASADRIGVCAWRCAKLLSGWGVRDLAGGDGVLEAYPAAALRCWGLPSRGYKARTPRAGPRAAEVRGEIVATLRRGCQWLALTLPEWTMCVENHDALDAVICALVARAASIGAVAMPAPDQSRAADREGWITLPAVDSLERMAR